MTPFFFCCNMLGLVKTHRVIYGVDCCLIVIGVSVGILSSSRTILSHESLQMMSANTVNFASAFLLATMTTSCFSM